MHISVAAHIAIVVCVLGISFWVNQTEWKQKRRQRAEARVAALPEAKRLKVDASRRRAQGHLWLLGAFLATLMILAALFGAGRPPMSPQVGLGIALIAVIDAVCIPKLVMAYRDARAIRKSAAGEP